MITNLKVQIEEDKIIEEALKEKLEERDKIIMQNNSKEKYAEQLKSFG
jgi:hypothetical protein